MSREFFLAGIGGYRPDLSYNPVEDRCSVSFPGYGQTVAMLPSNTVDAVLTSKGLLAYRDSKGEVRALQIADHEPIYQAAVAANVRERSEQKSLVTGMSFSQIMGRHTGGMVSVELSGHGPYRSEGAKEKMEDCTNGIVIDKDDMEKFAADLVREYIAPLVKNVQRMTALNAELVSRVKELEKRLEDKETVQPVVPAPLTDSPIRELSWGERGGLPNFLHPQDNPFCGKRRG